MRYLANTLLLLAGFVGSAVLLSGRGATESVDEQPPAETAEATADVPEDVAAARAELSMAAETCVDSKQGQPLPHAPHMPHTVSLGPAGPRCPDRSTGCFRGRTAATPRASALSDLRSAKQVGPSNPPVRPPTSICDGAHRAEPWLASISSIAVFNSVRARLKRLRTVPIEISRISAIPSYEQPSISRRTRMTRWWSLS